MKPEDVGSYLKELRLNHNLTQKELASKLHITHQAVSNWEKGKALPDITILSQLGDIYGVSIDNILLKQETEVLEEIEEPMTLKRIGTVFGLLASLFSISIFLHYDRHIVVYLIFVAFTLIISLVYSFKFRRRNNKLEYLIITGLLIVTFGIVFSSNPQFYMLNTTRLLMLTESKEDIYPREFDVQSDPVKVRYMFDEYALIYQEGKPNIDVFNLSNYQEEDYTIIDTNGIKIYQFLEYRERIFFTSYDENIPGEFKLYELDFESRTYEVLYESQDVFKLYTAFQDLVLVSHPEFETQTKIIHYNFDMDMFTDPVEVDYQVYGLSEYFVNDPENNHIESYFIMSTTNTTQGDPNNKIALFDYDYRFRYTLYDQGPGLVHLLYSKYDKSAIALDEEILVFHNLSYKVIENENSWFPQFISPEMIRVDEKIYIEDYETGEYVLEYDKPFYDKEFYPQGARYMIHSDTSNDYYVIDNEFVGKAEFYPREIDNITFHSSLRVGYLVFGILTYGFFVTLGHRKHANKDKKVTE